MTMRRFGLAVLLIAGWGFGTYADDLARELPRIPATEPIAAMRAIEIRPNFHLSLAAAEPLTTDPVAACYDADGRLYVVEMRGYPYPENQPSGNITRLVDRDGDGVFDDRTIFVDGLSWPTGVVPYDGGIYIAAAPDLLYAKDIDGDGRADVRRVVFSGFGIGNVQQLVNGLLWGTDGWIHGVAGGNGGLIRNLTKPDAPPVNLRGHDFRFRPDGSALEAEAGGGQFGHTMDDWGHRFTCNNSNHIRQVVLPSAYLDRVSTLAPPSSVVDIAAEGPAAPVYRSSPAEPWRVVRTRQRLADPNMASKLSATERQVIGFFTSATGVTLYRGSAYPTDYRGNAFIGDVGGNLVHRKTLAEDGPIFLATRAEADRHDEFLRSPDNWFRPVNFAATPSGTLLVLDMYRETIEHPFSIPEPIKKHLDLTSGKDRGRLYEILPGGFTARRPPPKLSTAGTAQLVALLADPDGWWRDTAQRLLIERRDPAAVPLLRSLSNNRPTALARAHALWTLGATGELRTEDLEPAFTDDEPGVREQAARLSEPHLGDPATRERLLTLAEDPSARVRFQTAFSLGVCDDPRTVAALARIADRDRGSLWTRWAVLSSLSGRFPAFFAALASQPGFATTKAGRAWIEELAALAGAGAFAIDPPALMAATGTDPAARRAAVIGLDRGLRQAGANLRAKLASDAALAAELSPLFTVARGEATNDAADPANRVEAIRVLAIGPETVTLEVVPDLLDATQPGEVQLAAARTLASLSDGPVADLLVERWRSLSPTVRREATEIIFARPARLAVLLAAIEAKTLAPNDIEPARRRALVTHKDSMIRRRASALFGTDAGADRGKVVAAWQPALKLGGDRDQGRAVYLKTCASCHRAEGQGEEVGPDLATVAGRSPDDLLVHILDPNREVAPPFLNYTVATKDGRIVSGLIAAENAGAVTLKRGGGVVDVVSRDRIEAMTSQGASLMPEGIEAGLSPADMANLISYLRTLQPR